MKFLTGDCSIINESMMSRSGTYFIGTVLRRVLVYGGYGVGALLFAALIAIWSRGKLQEDRIAALLAVDDEVSVQALYGPYQHQRQQPPDSMSINEDGAGWFQTVTNCSIRPTGFYSGDEPPQHLEWLIPIFGEHCFARSTDIVVYSEQFSDQHIDLLLAFPDLREVDLSETAITDAGFIRLISHAKLVELNVSGTKVSAAAMRRLADCKELKEIGLSDAAREEGVEAELQRALPGCFIY